MTTLELFILSFIIVVFALFLVARSAGEIYAATLAFFRSFRKETKDQFKAALVIVIVLIAGAAVLLLSGQSETGTTPIESPQVSSRVAIPNAHRSGDNRASSSSLSGVTSPVANVGQTAALSAPRSPGDFAITCPLDGNLLIVRSAAMLRFLPHSGVVASHDSKQAIVAYSTARQEVKGCVRNMHASVQPDPVCKRAFYYYVDSHEPSVFVEQNGMLEGRNFDIPRGRTACETLDFFEARTMLLRELTTGKSAAPP
jgi:hypothetical protein